MCPMCLAMSALYLAGGVSAGAVTTLFATKLHKRGEPTASTTSTEAEGSNRSSTAEGAKP
jgi:hypothetical protein